MHVVAQRFEIRLNDAERAALSDVIQATATARQDASAKKRRVDDVLLAAPQESGEAVRAEAPVDTTTAEPAAAIAPVPRPSVVSARKQKADSLLADLLAGVK